jgi:excisionase family DNA binding protein
MLSEMSKNEISGFAELVADIVLSKIRFEINALKANNDYIGVSEICQDRGICRLTVYRKLKTHKIPTHKSNGRHYILKTDYAQARLRGVL